MNKTNKSIPKPETYKGIYSIHKYWGKKPSNVIRYFIEKFSDTNDIVVDPFSGSGIAPIEASLTKRRGVGIDINPIAIQISYEMVNQINIDDLKREYLRIKNSTLPIIKKYYETKTFEGKLVASHYVWKESTLKEVWYKKGRKNVSKKPDKQDIILSRTTTYKHIPHFYPKKKLLPNSRINTSKGQHVNDLFTPRNLLVLAKIFNEIKKTKNKDIKSTLQTIFTASLGQASKMVFVVNNRKGKKVKKQVGSWVIGYWMPKEHFEINPLTCFENRYNRMLKAKKLINQHSPITVSKDIKEFFEKTSQLCLITGSSEKVLKKIPSKSVDYLITDPPHGNRIPYLELSEIWNSWFNNKVDYSSEMVISDSPIRGKNKISYFNTFEKILIQSKRIMKNEAIFSLLFNTLDNFTWIELLKLVQKTGFTLNEIETLNYSANSVIQDNRKFGLKNDFVLHLKKANGNEHKIKPLKNEEEQDIIKKLVEKTKTNNSKYSNIEILNEIITTLIKKQKICRLSTIIDSLKKG